MKGPREDEEVTPASRQFNDRRAGIANHLCGSISVDADSQQATKIAENQIPIGSPIE
jgi:hypothetical protein